MTHPDQPFLLNEEVATAAALLNDNNNWDFILVRDAIERCSEPDDVQALDFALRYDTDFDLWHWTQHLMRVANAYDYQLVWTLDILARSGRAPQGFA